MATSQAALPPTAPVLVTGCSSGIGKAAVLSLLRGPRPVWASARKLADLAELAAAGARTAVLDVTDEKSMASVVSSVEAEHGAVGALVNNAGYGEYGPVEEVPMDAVRRQFETNVFGLLRLTQLVLPAMRSAGRGRIVNVSSMGGRMTLPGGGIYHASKYAVEALSDALRFETRGFGVVVSVVAPGPVRTAFAEEATDPGTDDGPYAGFMRGVAARNGSVYGGGHGLLEPEAVADAIVEAVESGRPKARYPVGMVGRQVVGARRLLPTALWDAALRRQYPTP
ncbi:MAG TPA: SDR family NAD(P)-dependent oxidoreductase [Actinomycetes bacterium]|jgi:short-subunit dehydrogenase|nr:SDR family NAD(P)-dependent oxidoreductase [Actinomycetes bacterium]